VRVAKSEAATITRSNLVSRSHCDRHAQLALADAGGGDGGPSSYTSTQRPARRREPDRPVDRECGRSGRATELECNCEMERGWIGSLRRTFRLERSIGKWPRRVQLYCANPVSITTRCDPQNRLAPVRPTD